MSQEYTNHQLAECYFKLTVAPLSSNLIRFNQTSIISNYPEKLSNIYLDKKKWEALKNNGLKGLNTGLVEIILENGVDKAEIIVEARRKKSIEGINSFRDIPSQIVPNRISLIGRPRTYYR